MSASGSFPFRTKINGKKVCWKVSLNLSAYIATVFGGMTKKKPSWQEKLNNAKGYPKVEPLTGRMAAKWGRGTLVIPAPIEVDHLMKMVPKGKLTTINDVRSALAKKHAATIGCPLTTGIFAWISAHAAEEQRIQGTVDITPYWRTLRTGGFLNEKYPGGIENQKRLLEQEGHVVVKKGKRYFVSDYLNSVIELKQ
jgi:alkylated DNA nucleotide flippase Atl1